MKTTLGRTSGRSRGLRQQYRRVDTVTRSWRTEGPYSTASRDHILARGEDVSLFCGSIDADKCCALLDTVLPARSIDEAFVCGPGAMLDAVRDTLVEAGVPAARVHLERFVTPGSPAVIATPRAATRAAASDAPAADITVIADGITRTLRVPFDGASILDSALAAGADLPFACKGGVCCTCRARVLEGEVRMERNYSLEPHELARGFVLSCQSHPVTDRVVISYDARSEPQDRRRQAQTLTLPMALRRRVRRSRGDPRGRARAFASTASPGVDVGTGREAASRGVLYHLHDRRSQFALRPIQTRWSSGAPRPARAMPPRSGLPRWCAPSSRNTDSAVRTWCHPRRNPRRGAEKDRGAKHVRRCVSAHAPPPGDRRPRRRRGGAAGGDAGFGMIKDVHLAKPGGPMSYATLRVGRLMLDAGSPTWPATTHHSKESPDRIQTIIVEQHERVGLVRQPAGTDERAQRLLAKEWRRRCSLDAATAWARSSSPGARGVRGGATSPRWRGGTRSDADN